MAVLGRHLAVKLVQHGPGRPVLGLLLAAAAPGGGEVAKDHLEAEGRGV